MVEVGLINDELGDRMTDQPQHMIPAGDQQVALPKGVSTSQWRLEKYRWQNPRIRSLIGCIKMLESVMESNYAILHCSPARLHEVWRQVRQVAQMIRSDLGALLDYPSVVPELERARFSVLQSLEMLDQTTLQELEKFPEDVPADRRIEVRKVLCVSLGKLHAFLQDTFGEILAADPRSSQDSDYFLSRRFPRDIEEAEWLFASVAELEVYCRELENVRYERLTRVVSAMRREDSLAASRTWEELKEFLAELTDNLAPRLNEILALRGIRFDEMEILDDYALQIPTKSRLVVELAETGRRAIEVVKKALGESEAQKEQNLRDLMELHAVMSRRVTSLLSAIDRSLQDLWVFVPIWLQNIERRRALILNREPDAPRPLDIGTRE
jgi:hypothetical protein